jgi:tetratricopeptide (TPR) repeat protein
MVDSWRKTRRYVLAFVLIVSTLLAYHGVWHGGFIWDDNAYVTHNPLLTAPDGLRRIWFSLDAPSQYFPLVYTVFRFERRLWQMNPTGYHWLSLILHAGNALLVWRLLTGLRVPGPFLAAMIFALHPVQVESVAWITELKNVLMGFFFLLTLLAWIMFMGERTRRSWLYYGAALLSYILALSAKTTACTLPAALLLILWLQRKPITARRVAQIMPFFGIGAAMGLVTVWWERFHQGTRGEVFALGPVERVLVACRGLWFYLYKLLWPAKLTFIYPQWRISAHALSGYLWVAAVLALFVSILVARRWLGRGPEVAALFYSATLGPLLGFIMLYTFRYTYVADHYQYLACIGPIALFSAGLVRLDGVVKGGRILANLTAIVIVALLATLTWRQAATYRDVETLWRSTIAKNPDCWMAYNNLGIELARRGAYQEAIENYGKSLERSVGSKASVSYAEAHYNLANALLENGDVDRALTEARLAVTLQANDADARVALGNALLSKGRVEDSINEYSHALRINPDNEKAHCNLGNALEQKGDIPGAGQEYRRALELAPDNPEAHLGLGNVLFQQGREPEAIQHYSRALEIDAHSEKTQNNLAWALSSASDRALRDGRRGLALAQQANQSAGGANIIILHTLAAAYAQSGEFERAVATVREALAGAQSRREAELANELKRELQLYESGQVYRKP